MRRRGRITRSRARRDGSRSAPGGTRGETLLGVAKPRRRVIKDTAGEWILDLGGILLHTRIRRAERGEGNAWKTEPSTDRFAAA
jgi:hypothetical protein